MVVVTFLNGAVSLALLTLSTASTVVTDGVSVAAENEDLKFWQYMAVR